MDREERNRLEEELEQFDRDIENNLTDADVREAKAEASDQRCLQIEEALEDNLAELAEAFSKLSVLDQEDLMKAEPDICQEILIWLQRNEGRV